MFVICDGMPRSASTWSYNVVLGLVRRTNPLPSIHGAFATDTARFLEEAPAAMRHLVLKCHGLDPPARRLVGAGAAKAVYTHRNPADAVESAMWMFGLGFDGAVDSIASSLDLFEFHRDTGTGLCIGYDEIARRPKEAVAAIASYLELECDAATVDDVVDETSLSRVHEKLEEIALPETQARLARHGESVYDPDTLLHPGHVRTDEARADSPSLLPAQIDALERLSTRYAAVAGRRVASLVGGRTWENFRGR